MKCTLDGANASIFAKAIQSLSKLGPDLFIEVNDNGLQLRALNSTRSAVGSCKFTKTFFEAYHVKTGIENYYKISMKACLCVFRNMKQVERCELSIIQELSKFQVNLKCHLETLKNVLIAIIDEENINAAVPPDSMPNNITASHKTFTEISSNFNLNEEEITFEVQKDYVTIKNYIEGSRVSDNFMRSQLQLMASEFDHYNVSHKCHVTFCLKEFRAFLIFAESLNENLSLNLDDAGSPIFLKIKKYDQIECLLIMSTLSPDDISFYEDCNPAELTNANISIKRKLNVHDDEHKNQSKTRCIGDASTLSNDSRIFDDNGNTQNDLKSIDTPQNLLNNVSQICDSHVPLRIPHDSILNDTDSPVTFYDAGEIENECIPSSPGRNTNRMRSIFVRCFESTYVPKEPKPGCNVYISDSDAD